MVKLIKSIQDLEEKEFGLTIGNFDGVHLGHRAMLSEICDQLRPLPLVLVTFSPHPSTVLGKKASHLICSERKKYQLLSDAGVSKILVISFSEAVSLLAPEEFLRKYIDHEGLRKVFIGHDFCFGRNKTGDFSFASNYYKNKGVEVVKLGEERVSGERVSSTLIRDAICERDFIRAKKLLGREYSLEGQVVTGQGRGRTIGFPTLNLGFSHDLLIPPTGVYVTKILWQGRLYPSITNIGKNPTFANSDAIKIESHVFNFDQELYGEEIEVIPLKFVRNEMKFSSGESLRQQIKNDCEFAMKEHGLA